MRLKDYVDSSYFDHEVGFASYGIRSKYSKEEISEMGKALDRYPGHPVDSLELSDGTKIISVYDVMWHYHFGGDSIYDVWDTWLLTEEEYQSDIDGDYSDPAFGDEIRQIVLESADECDRSLEDILYFEEDWKDIPHYINERSKDTILMHPEHAKRAISIMENLYDYTHIVTKTNDKEKALRAQRSNISLEELQANLEKLDRDRTLAHNAAIAGLSQLNRKAEALGLPPVYEGKISEDSDERAEIANAIFQLCIESLEDDGHRKRFKANNRKRLKSTW